MKKDPLKIAEREGPYLGQAVPVTPFAKKEMKVVEQSLMTPEIEAMVGQESFFPGKEVIDRSSIRRYAQAISDPNPLYLDEEYAKNTRYGGIIAPPTFIFDVCQDIFSEVGGDGRDLSRVAIAGLTPVRAGNEYRFLEPARLGDIVNRRRKIVGLYEKEGKKVGKILFVTYETTYTNQEGKVLGLCRETMMFMRQTSEGRL